MKLPRDVSGRQLTTLLCRKFGYAVVHQSGSHIIIETGEPSRQRLSVPDHAALRIGTLNAILRAVADHKGVSRESIVSAM